MTAVELLRIEVNEAEYQLVKVLEGWNEADLDTKPLPTMMSAREQVEHLTEVYVAARKHAAGETHEWGSYVAADKNWGPLVSDMWTARASAEQAILTSNDPGVLSAGAAFLVSHDNYHIGQFCVLRIALDNSWDPYCIYPSE